MVGIATEYSWQHHAGECGRPATTHCRTPRHTHHTLPHTHTHIATHPPILPHTHTHTAAHPHTPPPHTHLGLVCDNLKALKVGAVVDRLSGAL